MDDALMSRESMLSSVASVWHAEPPCVKHFAAKANSAPGLCTVCHARPRLSAESANYSCFAGAVTLAWGGIPRLVEIGPARTKELVMTCRPFGAAEALAGGFLNRVVPASDLGTAVDQLVNVLIGKSAFALTVTKRHTNAVTEGIVGTARAWNDADSLVTALRDRESRAAGAAYLNSLGRG
jgi:enoyl-CoA hydratase/carnithine racemase